MAEYILAYHGGKRFEDPEEGKAHMAAWREWMGSVRDRMVNAGKPVGKSTTVSAEGASEGAPDPLSGYSIVNVDSLDEAIAIAQACPHLNIGTIEVAELLDIEM